LVPSRAFIKVDFPTFGRPIRATNPDRKEFEDVSIMVAFYHFQIDLNTKMGKKRENWVLTIGIKIRYNVLLSTGLIYSLKFTTLAGKHQ